MSKPAKRDRPAQEIAETYSVNEQTVRRWVKDGCPHSRGGRGKLWFNADEVNNWVHQTQRKLTQGRPAQPKAPIPPELEGDKDYWLARKHRVWCLKEEGRLVEASDVARWLSSVAATVGQRLTNLPASVVPRLQGQTPAEQEVIIREALDDARRSMAQELPDFAAA